MFSQGHCFKEKLASSPTVLALGALLLTDTPVGLRKQVQRAI